MDDRATDAAMEAPTGVGTDPATGPVPAAVPTGAARFGELLRTWRQRRRSTQLELSSATGVSTRHLSFLETGRSSPSRQMVLTLAEHLRVPLRERNVLLVAAGFAPAYPQRGLDAPELAHVRAAIDQVLGGHEPYPAIAVDRAWNVVAMNRGAEVFLQDVAPHVLQPQPNAYRLALHPDGLAPLIVNLTEVAHHLLGRLRHDLEVSADPQLAELLAEVERYPTVRGLPRAAADASAVVLPMRLRHPRGELAMFSTVTTFGTPIDVTLDEVAIEAFFPHDAATAQRFGALAEAPATAG